MIKAEKERTTKKRLLSLSIPKAAPVLWTWTRLKKPGMTGINLFGRNVPEDQRFRELIQKVEGHRNEQPELHRFVLASTCGSLAESS